MAITREDEHRFRREIEATTDKFVADYRQHPPAGKTPVEVAAFCEGFTEAVQMMVVIHIALTR